MLQASCWNEWDGNAQLWHFPWLACQHFCFTWFWSAAPFGGLFERQWWWGLLTGWVSLTRLQRDHNGLVGLVADIHARAAPPIWREESGLAGGWRWWRPKRSLQWANLCDKAEEVISTWSPMSLALYTFCFSFIHSQHSYTIQPFPKELNPITLWHLIPSMLLRLKIRKQINRNRANMKVGGTQASRHQKNKAKKNMVGSGQRSI